MDAATRQPRWGTLPVGVLGMLAVAAGVESFIARHELDAVSPDAWQFLLGRREAGAKSKGCDLLIFGDSLTKFGIQPKVIRDRSGLRAYNLAIAGSQAPASYDLLRRALEAGARPKAVVVDFSPLLLARPQSFSQARLGHLLDYGAALRLGWDAGNATFLADVLISRTIPSARCRATLRTWVTSALEGKAHRLRRLMPGALGHWARNEGAIVVPSSPGLLVDIEKDKKSYYPPRWVPDKVNAEYVRRFLELAEAHRVAVYWIITPIHPGIQEGNEASGHDARYVSFVRKYLNQFPNLVVIDGRHANYHPDVFSDAVHLGRDGAFVLSQDLGDLLVRLGPAAPAGGWYDLPRYRPRATDPGLLTAGLEVFQPEAPTTVRR